MRIKHLAAFACALTLAGGMNLFAAGPVTVKLMIHNSDQSMKNSADYIMSRIGQECPGIKVELDMVSGSAEDYETKVRTLIAAGNAPDVWWDHGGSWAAPILKAKGALALESYLDKYKFWDSLIASAKILSDDGHIYAIPFENLFYEVLFYNTEVFARLKLTPPKTAAELKKVVELLKANDLIPIALAGKDGWPAAMLVEGFAYTVDPLATRKVVGGKAKFSDEPYKRSAVFVKELIDMGAFSKNVALTDYGTALQLFEGGKAGMMANGSWSLGGTYKNMKGACDFFYYPALDASKAFQAGKSVAGGAKKDSGVFVSATAKDKDAAVKVAIAVGKLQSEYYYVVNGDTAIPFKPDSFGWKSKVSIPDPIKRIAKDMASYQNVFGLVQDVMPTAAATTGVMQATSAFMTGTQSVEDYLSEMDSALSER
jgi:raffinose/stachyose/melibiose transport system substrate-binding protein